MATLYLTYWKVINRGRVLTAEQVPDIEGLWITPNKTQAQVEGETVVVPAGTWMAQVGKKWFLVPDELKKAIRESGEFNLG